MSSGEGQVISVHTEAEWKAQKEQLDTCGNLGVVDFTASWCGPCRMFEPLIAEVAKKLTNVIFLKVDVHELQGVAGEYSVEKMPTFLLFKNGKIVDKMVGANKEGLSKIIEKHIPAAA